ncbi:hypothetical protein K1T71_012556 [Dendrolimus kikuchii]|uniref:Uncharacterized protein n=1 Tax=Dendrolimus kikuchii TaxID=765133 RepID=A0ACC1CJR5_9NEOP|nr:hypothetical protein K1T71_012556 [Dendrolimus kikuchii]
MEKRCTDLQNNLKNINLKYEVLETKIHQIEQSQLANQLEICGIKETEKEDVEEIAKDIAMSILQAPEDIIKVYRKKRNRLNNQKSMDNSVITVILREGIRDMWIEAAKSSPINAEKLGLEKNNKIYLRESLTPATAFLLWKTKEELKGTFKFIWCKHGSVLVRKSENKKL